MKSHLLALVLPCMPSLAFQAKTFTSRFRAFSSGRPLHAEANEAPQVFASGYSPKLDLQEALQEATEIALQALPGVTGKEAVIDLAVVTVSSLYDGQSSPSLVVPAVVESASGYGAGIQSLIGCSTGGIIASIANLESVVPFRCEDPVQSPACTAIESEGVPGVAVTLCLLPDVNVTTFHVLGDDVPDDSGQEPSESWKRSLGLGHFEIAPEDESTGSPVFMVVPSPAFQKDLDDLLAGIHCNFPKSTVFGGIASTVSSLSRARLFRYDVSEPRCVQTLAEGCVGVMMQGDIFANTRVAQGAKPVGGIYRVVSGSDSTIKAIVLDEGTLEKESESFIKDDDTKSLDSKAMAAAEYAKARIPKAVLAEANFLMKGLSDDDRSFMKKALLVGLEHGGTFGRENNALARLEEGEGYQFSVYQVASAGMKDGSVTLPLGTVEVQPGTRLRFFVRESDFAKREVNALWTGYNKRELSPVQEGEGAGPPSVCVVISTLDRGAKLFGGRGGFESESVSRFLPDLPCITGFFSNGVIGRLDSLKTNEIEQVYGSATSFTMLGSRTQRPIYLLANKAAAEASIVRARAENLANEKGRATGNDMSRSVLDLQERAPRDANGELILKRREVHSGRAISVSTVEWSVAEKTANPTSMLEGFMWDKEAEVDRFRERVPLSNLVSQCRLSLKDPNMPKPREWVGPVMSAYASGSFALIPECKRIEPSTGSLRKRYDLEKLARQFTMAGVPALSVNCDGVLFGGTIDDIGRARRAATSAAIDMPCSTDGAVAPPVLASDLILYPYQLYKLRLAGADAVNLLAGALYSKDVVYLTKIARSLQLQVLLTVTSSIQIQALLKLPKGSIKGLIVSNRELEDFTFDMTGEQALDLLTSKSLEKFRNLHGDDIPVLVEGRVGIIRRRNNKGDTGIAYYVQELQEAGATGAIIGGGLAIDQNVAESLASLMKVSSGSY